MVMDMVALGVRDVLNFLVGGDTGFLGSVHYLNETLMHLSFKHILLAREGSQINSTPMSMVKFTYFILSSTIAWQCKFYIP